MSVNQTIMLYTFNLYSNLSQLFFSKMKKKKKKKKPKLAKISSRGSAEGEPACCPPGDRSEPVLVTISVPVFA